MLRLHGTWCVVTTHTTHHVVITNFMEIQICSLSLFGYRNLDASLYIKFLHQNDTRFK